MFNTLIIVMFYKWVTDPAEWWEFWKPGSGFIGGITLAVIALTLALASKLV